MTFTIFIGIFYLIGFGLLGYGLLTLIRSTNAKNWPTAKGIVESSSIQTSSDSEGGSTYQVVVQYSYTVNNKKYTNDKIAFGYVSSSGEEAHLEILNKIKNASAITVRYEPNNPQNAVLSFGFHRSIQFIFAFAITWLAFVIGFTVLYYLFSKPDSTLLENLNVYKP